MILQITLTSSCNIVALFKSKTIQLVSLDLTLNKNSTQMAVSRKTVHSKTDYHPLLSIWINKTTGVVWQRVLYTV